MMLVPVVVDIELSDELKFVATFMVNKEYTEYNEKTGYVFQQDGQQKIDEITNFLRKELHLKNGSLPFNQKMALIAVDFSFLNCFYRDFVEYVYNNISLPNQLELASIEIVGCNEAYVNLDVIDRVNDLCTCEEEKIPQEAFSLFDKFNKYEIKTENERDETLPFRVPSEREMKQMVGDKAVKFEIMLKGVAKNVEETLNHQKRIYSKINELTLTEDEIQQLPDVFKEQVYEARYYKDNQPPLIL